MTKTIDLQNAFDFSRMIHEFSLESFKLISFSIGSDDAVYFHFERDDPDTCDTAESETSPDVTLRVIIMSVDWTSGEVIHTECFDLGKQGANFHYCQPLGEDLLLLGARSQYYGNGRGEENALLITKKGELIRKFCLGDGIGKCLVNDKREIITAYFDEGVFGNYGWNINNTLGSAGLVVWNEFGQKIWENSRFQICDCYAMTVDLTGTIWFSYYSENHKIIQTDRKKATIFTINDIGIISILINRDQTGILTDGGYSKYSDLVWHVSDHEKIINSKRVVLIYNCETVKIFQHFFRSNKAVFLDDQKRLFFKEFL